MPQTGVAGLLVWSPAREDMQLPCQNVRLPRGAQKRRRATQRCVWP